jgi:signal transduction histidine kinase
MYRTRRVRLVTISCLCLVILLLLIRDAAVAYASTSFLSSTLRFGFSTLVASAFLSLGALVWYYACNRLTAHLLFGFSSAMAITFAVQSGAVANDPLLSVTTSMSSLVALLCLNALLLVFPSNHISWPPSAIEQGEHRGTERARPRALVRVLRGYLGAQTALCLAAIGDTVFYFLEGTHAPPWLPLVVYLYVLAGLIGVLVSVRLSSRYASGLRERQQLRLLVNGTVFAVAPFLILTLFPSLLGFPAPLVVDSRISTATLVVLPLALGYAVLRYQLLFFEASVRRVVTTLVGLFSLALLTYLIVAITSVALPGDEDLQVGGVVLALIVLGSVTWWGVQAATERLFFNEISHYRKLFSRPQRLAAESFDLDEAAWLVVAAAVDAFALTAACVFLLDEESGCFRPYFPLNRHDSHRLAEQVFQCIRPVVILGKKTDWLDREDPVLVRLAGACRPLRLSELCRAEGDCLSVWLPTTHSGASDPLLAPLWGDGKMVGMLVLGARGDGQAYAGPDFAAIELIGRRYTPALETARLYALDSAHAALVMKLFTGLPQSSGAQFKTQDAVVSEYARVIASAASARAEAWLVGEEGGVRVLRRVLQVGPGPTLGLREPVWVEELQEQMGLTPTFLTWQRSPGLLESQAGNGAPGRAPFSCAWLPLLRGEELCGALVLNYARPHTFSPREQRLLVLFANQCAAALENTRILCDLDVARARDIESDRMLDQFLLAATRSLRLSLTTAGGYIEMVRLYGDRLSPETRSEFLAHASRAANEMVLLVSTIMDALQLTDVERAPLEPVPLLSAIRDMQELLQVRRLCRDIALRVDVPVGIQVFVDGTRLRQILLNLLSTALAFADAATVLEVSAQDEGGEVTVYVRCIGTRVSPDLQKCFFDPFSHVGPGAPGGRTGLGLAISKRQVEGMGGRLWVMSEPSQDELGILFAFALRSARVLEGSQVERSSTTSRSLEQPG